ncbi:hypothetical protein [Streptomyces sp. MAR4 CNX-425]|uniref:hypothetical protein n=1 Tax=Streptomyces sp. MAR4 CNX-425 TaxID=3406343 RepID=UPI003B5124DB
MSLTEPQARRRPTWVKVTTALGRSVYVLAALPPALLAMFVPMYRGAGDCSPGEPGPCDHIHEMSDTLAALLFLGVLALLAAGAVAQSAGARRAAAARKGPGLALVFGPLAVPAVAYAILVYAYTPA